MTLDALFASPWGALLIFGLRVVDVSIDTMRVIFAIRGRRGLAAILGGTQALIWIVAVGNAIKHLDSILHIFGYAAGYATGTFVGVTIEGYLAYGVAMTRIVSSHGGDDIADALRERGYGVTKVPAEGREGPVEVLFAAVERSHLPDVMQIVERLDEGAFVTVEEPKVMRGGLLRTREWPVFKPQTYFDRLRNGG
jgi:uncharacterized protein YebE (UPF0316 family)